MPVEVIVKEHEIAIYIDREKMRRWLGVTSVNEIPWEEAKNPTQKEIDDRAEELRILHEKSEGYRTGDGETREFPNPVDNKDVVKGDPNGEEADDAPVPGSINLFDDGPTGIGGTLQDDPKAKEKMKAMKDWLKAEKFNYKNFCIYLYQLKEVAGFKLSTPLIGLTQKKEPSMFQLATRYYSYWLSGKDYVAKDYKDFLVQQLADIGITIQMVKDEFDGEEIDPKNLPKSLFEVSA